MKFYSTNNKAYKVDLKQAVMQGLAPDNGLYMPESIPVLPQAFYRNLPNLSFQEIGFIVAVTLLQDAVPEHDLRKMIEHTIQFDAPLKEVESGVYTLELFHGPTLAFKDFGARFMSQMLGYFAKQQKREIIILVATSGDTGSAVANGFLGVEGTRVIVLYPSGKVSEIQEKQFTTLGQNVTALEVNGTFDDCQRLVKQAFLDNDLRSRYFLTSANSINIARLVPQSFYYFHAVAQLKGNSSAVVFAVPSGNFGNLTGGLIAQRMGLPVKKFLAVTNDNDVVPEYLQTLKFNPRDSVQTISNAMDVGNPSNFVRMMDLFNNDNDRMRDVITGFHYNDLQTSEAMRDVFARTGYMLDPHGAVGYLGLKEYLKSNKGDTGIFLETAHPAKFKEVVDRTLNQQIEIPVPLQAFLKNPKQTIPMAKEFEEFRSYLIKNL
jgi:threonine synthase